MKSNFPIGEAAALTGVPAKTIRYYEDTGLLPKPQRTKNGYRSYVARDVHVLRFIKRARDLGFTIHEVGQLLELWQNNRRHSSEVKKLADAHLARIEKKILALRSLEDSLRNLTNSCRGDDSADCPILNDLSLNEPEL